MTDIVSSDLTGILLQYGDDTPINITALQVQEGDNTPVAVWAEEYTLSITKTNPGYIKSAIVNRTASQYGHGATGELSNGATLYYGDTLTAAATAADTTTSYTEWVPSYISKPTFTNKTDTSVQVNNSNAFAVTLYYKVSGASSYTSVAIAANSNTTLSGLTAGSEYVFYFTASKSRTKTVTTYSVTKSWASLTVDSNESITFTGSASPVESTETGTLTSSTQSYVMPYKITLTKNNNVSSISLVFYPFNDHAQTEVTAAGTYYGKANTPYSWTATAATEYNISSGSGSGTLSSAVTIAPTASRKTFTITFAKTGISDSAWNSSTAITAEYGDYIQRSGSTVTVYKWDATSTARATRTFNNGTNAAYTYGTATYTNAPTTKTQLNRSTTYAVSVAQDWTRKSLTVTLSKSGATDSAWSKATLTGQYGDQIAVSGTTVTLYKWDSTGTARDSATFNNGTNAAYTYGTATYTGATSTKTAINATTATVTATQSWTRKSFKVYLNKDAHPNSVWKTGNTAVTYLTAYYGDWIQRSDAKVTIYKWDANTTERTSATFSNSSNPNTVWYNANAPTTKTQLNRSTDYTLSCVTGWTITYATNGYGTWKRNGTESTTLTAYYGDMVAMSQNSSTHAVTVTIYIGSDTSRIRDTYPRIFTPNESRYNVSYTSLSSVTGRHTITATTGYAIPISWGGSYCSTYRGTINIRQGNATTGAIVWSKTISASTSGGIITGSPNPLILPLSSSTTYYMTGDVYGSGIFDYYVASANIVLNPNKVAPTAQFTINRRRALSCQNPGCLGNEGFN